MRVLCPVVGAHPLPMMRAIAERSLAACTVTSPLLSPRPLSYRYKRHWEPTMTVSYVLTVYNKAAFLPAVLSAVMKERAVSGGEIVIVDDGSIDGSSILLDEF